MGSSTDTTPPTTCGSTRTVAGVVLVVSRILTTTRLSARTTTIGGVFPSLLHLLLRRRLRWRRWHRPSSIPSPTGRGVRRRMRSTPSSADTSRTFPVVPARPTQLPPQRRWHRPTTLTNLRCRHMGGQSILPPSRRASRVIPPIPIDGARPSSLTTTRIGISRVPPCCTPRGRLPGLPGTRPRLPVVGPPPSGGRRTATPLFGSWLQLRNQSPSPSPRRSRPRSRRSEGPSRRYHPLPSMACLPCPPL
mmetsp:Transcript_32422/g.95560  ORF Transcript_32422/g.95560 Transcript_32422/m.95560 type:complete len:248 (+) Transcript_32422:385-1128(+)